MLDNHLYNLLLQITQEHKSLWRIKNMYKKDAGGCDRCLALWEKFEHAKDEHIKELKELLKLHIAED